ncbi:putative septum site-determining protein MinC [Trichostrongylus colubriformis]|uniref:Septum site-determining protein MinC n=1 Tax=Trichostrongylus colubriformis TaxID=6319 RepID=A0AAN8IMP2_TRICO
MGVLHEGTGPRINTARVEIVFDNTDRRIPAIEGTEVRVVRQVGQKKDQYYIDGKMVPRAEVVNLMESAGFSRSNPYYIVKQGKINELATAPDSHRLKLLREVAGTRVYDERKEESLKILKETHNKTTKIETLLSYIDERLKTLEEEKEDLKEYQKWDKMKRSIEYTIYDTEANETRKKLERLLDQREELNTRQTKVSSELVEVQARGVRAGAEQRKLESRFKGMKEEKEALVVEQAQRFEKKAELALLINDLKEDVEKEKSGRNKAEDVLNQVKAEIREKEEELERISPKYQELVEKEAALSSDIRIAEMKSKELFAKQGHKDQFKSAEERDAFLRREVRHMTRQIDDTEEQMKDIEKSLEDEAREEEQLTTHVQELGVELHENHIRMDKASSEHGRLKQEFDRAMSVTNGVEGVRRIVQWFRDNNHDGRHDDVIKGYHGIFLDLIDCDPIYFQAVEVTAGNRLLFHVVSDDRVALKIMKQFNQQNLPGECNFFPVNRVVGPPRKEYQDADGRAILDVFDYDEYYDAVFRNVFAGTAIVRDLHLGARFARSEGFDCVTLDGDQISKRGALTGGYIDTKRSKLELHKSIRGQKMNRDQLQVTLNEIQRKVNEKMSAVEKLQMEIDKADNDMRVYKQQHRNLTEKKRYASEQLHAMGRNREPKKAQLLNLRNRVRELRAQLDSYESQIGSEFLSQISKSEQQECERLQREILEKKQKLDQIAKERSTLETTKQRLENQLRTNLLRKRDSLTAKISDIAVDEKRHNLQAESAELNSVIQRLNEIVRRIAELDEHLMEYEESAEKLNRELEDVQEQQKDLEAQLADFSKQADIIFTKQSTLQSKREENVKKIRELGSLPTDAFSKYQGMSTKQLDKKLAECMHELKKYENVNKKALDQFVQAASQKEELTKRMEEQHKSQKAIEDLLQVLDTRKFEAIQLTFKQVSKNFVEVFQKLVPAGSGSLIIQTSKDDSIDASQHGESQSRHIVENFVGVGIKVSFDGGSETREMVQLSGGQKSLVALALIFAIQKCDPAPFYLFDEIDAALDAQHRKAVADMIHELAENAQFITTTFRPELLESAEKFYGVRFRNKVSHIDVVTREQAYDFVEDDTTHG